MTLKDKIYLEEGAHHDREDGFCIAEVVAYLAGEPHTDWPACASPVLIAFASKANDVLDDEPRQELLPLAAELVDTRCDRCEGERAKSLVFAAIRESLPETMRFFDMPVSARSLLTQRSSDLDQVYRFVARLGGNWPDQIAHDRDVVLDMLDYAIRHDWVAAMEGAADTAVRSALLSAEQHSAHVIEYVRRAIALCPHRSMSAGCRVDVRVYADPEGPYVAMLVVGKEQAVRCDVTLAAGRGLADMMALARSSLTGDLLPEGQFPEGSERFAPVISAANVSGLGIGEDMRLVALLYKGQDYILHGDDMNPEVQRYFGVLGP